MSLFGLGSSKVKNTLDPWTTQAQQGNFTAAQGLTANYTPTSAAQIQQYQNPYTENVVNQSLGALDRSRQMAVNGIGDQAQAAHAFGGSRHGVAEGITNEGYANQAGLLSANLYNQGYGQALQAAQDENRFGYQYPLARQASLTGALSQVRGNTTQKTQDPAAAFSNFGGLLNTAGNIAAFFA